MRTWTTGQYLLLLLLSCLNGPVAIGKICRLALVVDDGRGAAPSDEMDPVEATLEDPDGGRVSTGKAEDGGRIKEGKAHGWSSSMPNVPRESPSGFLQEIHRPERGGANRICEGKEAV